MGKSRLAIQMFDSARPHSTVDGHMWQPLRGPFERWPQATDFLIATVAFTLTLWLWSLSVEPGESLVGSLLTLALYWCAFVGNYALLWRRSHAWQVHAVVLGASSLALLGPFNDSMFALVFSLYSLGRYEPVRRASIIGMLAAVVFVVTDLFVLSEPSAGGTAGAGLVILFWYIGRRLRFRGEYLRLLEERAEHLERERDIESERTVAAERTRIAREMHDVVAHQVSLMTVQAGAAKTVSQSDPQAAGEAMAAIEHAGRSALAEMRHLLDVLRPADQKHSMSPQPRISDLRELVGKVRDAGLTVQLETTGSIGGLPARLELTAYRIVQEALTNVIKHAGVNVTVSVRVAISDGEITVSVKDNGRGGGMGQASGHGIAGMRERVALLDGQLSAGAHSSGGFEVRATLPLKAGQQ